MPISQTDEYKAWQTAGQPPASTRPDQLDKLIGNNRQGQRDRYYFLPAAWDREDLVVDLQRLSHRPYAELKHFQRLATLDDPYAQSLIAQLGRYIGRMGTPDLDIAAVRARLAASADAVLARQRGAVDTDASDNSDGEARVR
jgi:hypothetical protein